MEEALRALLLADAALAGLVETRVSWGRRPQSQSELPAIVLQTVSARREYVFGGPVNLVPVRVQADIYGATFGTSKLAARALVDLVSGFRGAQGDTLFQGIFVDGERDTTETESPADRHLFRTSIDLIVWHQQEHTHGH